jgi:hypothetical protein
MRCFAAAVLLDTSPPAGFLTVARTRRRRQPLSYQPLACIARLAVPLNGISRSFRSESIPVFETERCGRTVRRNRRQPRDQP